jgi:hypothetical protein
LGWVLAGVGLGLPTLAGCQTWYGGMTLPSPRYLNHPPQYIPDSPAFTHPRELAYQEEIARQPGPGGLGGGLPPVVPSGGVP